LRRDRSAFKGVRVKNCRATPKPPLQLADLQGLEGECWRDFDHLATLFTQCASVCDTKTTTCLLAVCAGPLLRAPGRPVRAASWRANPDQGAGDPYRHPSPSPDEFSNL
jgi:hypothetical protein